MLEGIGDIVSVVGFLFGVLYGIGLVIVTIHLSRYGIIHVYLVRTKYLVVGFTYFLHMLGMAILAGPVALVMIWLLGPHRSLYIAGPLGVLGLLILLLFGYSPSFFQRTIRSFLTRKLVRLSARIDWYIWYVGAYLSFLLCWCSLVRALLMGQSFAVVMSVCLCTAVIVGGIVYYALFLYQNPVSVGNPALELIGSGRPIQVRLTVRTEAIPGLREYGLFEDEQETTTPVLLLDETDRSYFLMIVSDDKERALEVSKAVVNGVIYLP